MEGLYLGQLTDSVQQQVRKGNQTEKKTVSSDTFWGISWKEKNRHGGLETSAQQKLLIFLQMRCNMNSIIIQSRNYYFRTNYGDMI